MTAPTSDELRLKRFMRVRPRHTGLGIAPNTDPVHHWWFPHEAAVERHEEHHACLFCRECQTAEQGGIALAPLLVDYDKDPLKAVVAIAETVCVSCRGYSTYPVTEVFDLGDTTVNIRTYGYPSPASMLDSEAYDRQMQRLAQSNQGFQVYGQSNHLTQAGLTQAGLTQAGLTQAGLTQAGLTQAGLTQAGLTQAGSAQSVQNLFNRAIASLKNMP